MKTEVSSGGVIIKSNAHRPQVLLLKDTKGEWTFPKGLIDKGEDPLTTAKRECKEEVGITDLSLVSELTTISFWYTRNGEKIHKTVHYFLFRTNGEEVLIPQKEEGITEVKYVPFDQALEIIGYRDTNVGVLEKAKDLL